MIMEITSKAVEFLKPYIESNNFWNLVFLYVGIGALLLLGICIWIEQRNCSIPYRGEMTVMAAIVINSIVLAACLIGFLVTKIENYDMKKFPVKHYNEKTRFFEER